MTSIRPAAKSKKSTRSQHPSSLLLQPDEESREREYPRFVADLRTALKASAAK
jgi:hypothetical protein